MKLFRYFALVVLALCMSCATLYPRRTTPADCRPRLHTPFPTITAYWYDKAAETLAEIGHAPPEAVCGKDVVVTPVVHPVVLMVACESPRAMACIHPAMGGQPYRIYYDATRADSLHHEFMHMVLWERGMPGSGHHRTMNEANVYYYPRGSNPNAR